MGYESEVRAFADWANERGWDGGDPRRVGTYRVGYLGRDAEAWGDDWLRLIDHAFFVVRAHTLDYPGIVGNHGTVELAVVARTYLPETMIDSPPPEWAGLKLVKLPRIGTGLSVMIFPVATGPGTDAYLQLMEDLPAHLLNVALPEQVATRYGVSVTLVGGRDQFFMFPLPADVRATKAPIAFRHHALPA